ncbi:InlB B-repeat-containing protein [Lysinibacillus xylanilyticus]|uniref:InlB B-repeat-containing protein n=1 Tax=Lysinibacillus xylanilyticus TaxID=582475 RepID=UPI003CFE97C0
MWDLPNNCTVTFESNGGNNVPTKTIECRNLLIEPTNPMKEGYIFVGRYKNEELTEAWILIKV